MRINVNGEARETQQPATVASLLDELSLAARHVAVEVNGQLVPRGQHAGHDLAEGDQLEVVTLVGGG